MLDHPGQVNVFLIACLLSPGGFVGRDGGPDLPALRERLRAELMTVPLAVDRPRDG